MGTLTDILVHGQDIAIPLERRLDSSPTAAAIAASFVWRLGYPFHAQRKLRGFRLTGRLATLEHVSGDGAAALTTQLNQRA
nr:hypothetical protein [Kibdelosporangium sp. MJ126-NF4]CEL13838.1 hypothetical protein [Kibdelosporangium sp. MJ126-NF4]CTQ88206.1 hypothetical protein [Kibdelosporangium sp. MJ126-NF4]